MQIVRLWPLGSLAPGAGGSKRAGLTQIVRPALLLGFGPLRLDIDILRLDIDILRPDIDILRPDIDILRFQILAPPRRNGALNSGPPPKEWFQILSLKMT